MNAAIFVFMLIWVAVSVWGMARPSQLMQSFPTLTRVWGFEPDAIPPKILLFFQAVAVVCFIFGVSILFLLGNGTLQFLPKG